MDRNGRFAKMLSGLCAIAFLLGFYSLCQAATNVYWITPQGNTHNSGYNSVSETFVATADSVTKIGLFLGAKSGSSNYQMEIDSAGILKGGVLTVNYAGAVSYADNEGNYGPPLPVKRGCTYTLKFSRQSAMETVDFYYVTDTMAYPWGKITQPGTLTGDLCARAVGVNRTDSTFWGENGEATGRQDSLITPAKDLGICLDREQFQWEWIQPANGSFNWSVLDNYVDSAKAHGLRVMINFYGTPWWASTSPDTIHHSNSCNLDSSGPYWNYPPRNLDVSMPPDSNYLWKFANALAARYGPQGVHDYEVYNEVGAYTAWRYGRGRDTLYYDKTTYDRSPAGRAKLYAKACQVAYNAIKAGDPQATIYTNAVYNINTPSDCEGISGKQWLQYFYDAGGKNYSDVITYHWYLCFDDPSYLGKAKKKFWSKQFIADYDTLRRVMRDNGDGAKPAWADEGGYGAPPAGVSEYPYWSVGRDTQANIVVQAFVTGLGQRENGAGPAIGQVNWYKLLDRVDSSDTTLWAYWCGLVNLPDSHFTYKPAAYAYKQMTGKLKSLYFNRRVAFTDTLVYCYEFQDTGAAGKKTWVIWKDTLPAVVESLSVRTNTAFYDSTYYRSPGPPPFDLSNPPYMQPNGTVAVPISTVPLYVYEGTTASLSRPDVVVDDLYTSPPSPKAGEGLKFFARIKNIGNDSVRTNIPNWVTFQVDGITKASYQASRGLAPAGDPNHKDTLTVGYFFPGYDWTATWGDHLIRAWADSADRYVELREDNNQGYIFKHFQPKVSVVINNDHKFTNHLTNDTLLT